MTDSASNVIRIGAVADLHYSLQSQASFVPMLEQLGSEADVLLLCGDLTHHGLVEEAAALVKEMGAVRMPVLAVLGNHDHHSDQQDAIKRLLIDSSIHLLDGDAVEVKGIGFAGVKGFATGFGRYILEPWGEAIVKQFVREAVEESLRLESALASLRVPQRIALLHYAPIAGTVIGEPLEIYPFLGSSRLEELNRFQVAAAFHGHAHHGSPEGTTSTGVPVYNVSIPLLRRVQPERPPYRIVEIEASSPVPTPPG
jgi:Icc-related predicted phosphoesterase